MKPTRSASSGAALRPSSVQVDMFIPSSRNPPSSPSPPSGKYKLRSYQQEADRAIDKALEKKRSCLLVLPTGGGKTLSYAEQARKRGTCLVLAPRNDLIKQAAQKIRHHTGGDVAIEKAEREAYDADYVVASVQSLHEERLERFAKKWRDRFALVIGDEVHHGISKSWRRVFDAFPEAKLLGGTATPNRSDGVGLWTVLDRAATKHGAAYVYRIKQAMDEGWLTGFKYRPVFAPIDLNKMKAMQTGDIDPKALDQELVKQAAEIAKALIDSCHGRTLGFTTGVASAEMTALALNNIRSGCARFVHGGMPDDEKERIGAAHRRGDFDYLINCAIYIEGYDDPGLMNVFDAALTKSVMRHVQKFGRGPRLAPDIPEDALQATDAAGRKALIAASSKPTWNYFHLNGIGNKHDIATPVDTLAGTDVPDDVKKLAKEILREGGGGNVEEALSEAKQRIEQEKARLAARAAREAEWRKTQIGAHRDPFKILHLKPQEEWETVGFDPASEPQRRRLRELGVQPPEKLTKPQASRMIGACEKRKKLGLATYDQLRRLAELGIQGGMRMKSTTAHDILSAHRDKQLSRRLPWLTSWGGQSAEVRTREPGEEG